MPYTQPLSGHGVHRALVLTTSLVLSLAACSAVPGTSSEATGPSSDSTATSPSEPDPEPTLIGTYQEGYDLEGREWVMENQGVSPDIVQDNDPAKEFAGEDQQLNKAVEVLKQEARAWSGLVGLDLARDATSGQS